LSTVELVSIQGTTLHVRGLDAIEGTPVIDIKPYYPPYDVPKGEVRVPEWIWRLAY
jgi:tRNA (adenine37-N6)-methyltransferase